MNAPFRTTLIAALGLLGLQAEAATIALQPSQVIVQQGSDFTINLVLNATDAPGSHPGLFGGQVVIDYDPSQLLFTGFSTELNVYSPVTTGTAGSRSTVTLGFDHATDSGVVGSFGFRAIGSPTEGTTIGLRDADDFMGTFVSYVPTYQAFYPTALGTSLQIQAVPLPGAAWLALTALGAAATRLRRRSPEQDTATRR